MTQFVVLTLFSLLVLGEGAVRPLQLRTDGGECADADNQMTFTRGKITEIGNFDEADVVSAQLIAIEYFSNYKVLTEKMAKELYILTQCGTTPPSQTDLADVLSRHVNYTVKHFTIPLQIASSSSTIHLSFFEALGLEERIEYISQYSSGPCWQKALDCGAQLNADAVPSQMSQVEAHFMDCSSTNPVVCDNVNGEAKGVHISATQDPAPLHSAEHIKFIAAFFNKEEEATALFSKTLSAYAGAAVAASPKPVVAWVSLDKGYNCGGCEWETKPQFELRQAHYQLKMVIDAGGLNVDGTAVKAQMGSKMTVTQAATGNTYYVKLSSFNGSKDMASAALFAALGDVDVIIDTTSYWPAAANTITFNSFMDTMSLASTSNLKFMKNKMVLRNDGTVSDNGNDWHESRVAHPEWAVEGLARQIHGDTKFPFKYFRNIAKGEDSEMLLASSCKSQPAACLADAYPSVISGLFNTKVQGSVTIAATGLTQAQLEAAAKKSLALHFGVAQASLTATATEARRLGMDDNSRRLAGTWTISYVLFASPAQVASVNAKVTAATNDPAVFQTSLTAKVKAALKDAGVSATVADALTITAATAVVPTPSATTGTSATTGSSATTGTTATTGGVSAATTGTSATTGSSATTGTTATTGGVSAASNTVAFISLITVIKALSFGM